MSRSSPSGPLYLLGAISRIEALLREAGPLTAREIAGRLRAEAFEWPLPARRGWVDPTPERVKGVCEMRGNRTRISRVDNERPIRYCIDPLFARDKLATEGK